MKLFTVDYFLDWPSSVELIDLRKFIIENLMKKGRVIRWSIVDIQDSVDFINHKKLRIYAVLAN